MTATRPRSAPSGDTLSPARVRPAHSAEKVCIFSHFDSESVVRRYVFEYLRAIVSAGFSVLFVSTADRVTAEDRDRLEALGIDVHVRENKGLDFGSWQYGMNQLGDMAQTRHLLLANDSVFGPLFDLTFMIEQMNRTDADFWGVTDSYEGSWHLQSYFLCFKSNVIHSDAFRGFFAKDFSALPKQQVIVQGEIALSQTLLRAGFAGAASCPYGALTEDRFGRLCDPTQHYWDELIEKCRSPFIKRLLLRKNPNGVENLGRWREVVGRATDYDISLIEEYLAVFGESSPSTSPFATASFYLRAVPTALRLALRIVAKTFQQPRGTVLAMEQYLATDRTKMPPHPGRRPTIAYADLEAAAAHDAGTQPLRAAGNGSRVNRRRKQA